MPDLREALVPLADVTGRAAIPAFSRACFDRSLARAACVVVSSRRKSPYAAALTRSTGRPFLHSRRQYRLPWYQPPTKAGSVGRSNNS